MSRTSPLSFAFFLALLFSLGILNSKVCLKKGSGWIALHLILALTPGTGLIALPFVLDMSEERAFVLLAPLTLAYYLLKQNLRAIAERRKKNESIRAVVLATGLVVASTLAGFFGIVMILA